MSYGFTAYESYVRIHAESGGPAFPGWTALPQLGRMAWEAAAQAVALAVLPTYLNPDPLDDLDHDEEPDEFADDSPVGGDRLDEARDDAGTSTTDSLPQID
ncbi:MAG: hypothetical protein WCH39_04035 [Schlesneria sp.]